MLSEPQRDEASRSHLSLPEFTEILQSPEATIRMTHLSGAAAKPSERETNGRTQMSWVYGLVTIGLVAILTYASAYLWFGSAWRPGPPGPQQHPIRMRVFKGRLAANCFRPAAYVESMFRGYSISVGDHDDFFHTSP